MELFRLKNGNDRPLVPGIVIQGVPCQCLQDFDFAAAARDTDPCPNGQEIRRIQDLYS